jgi:putative transcriptional regulator
MITNQVSTWRKQRGITKAHLARYVGVSRSYVTRLEQGKLQPSGGIMFRVAAYFKAPIEQIFQFCPECCQSGNAIGRISSSPVRQTGRGPVTGKSLVFPTAGAVASLTAK